MKIQFNKLETNAKCHYVSLLGSLYAVLEQVSSTFLSFSLSLSSLNKIKIRKNYHIKNCVRE